MLLQLVWPEGQPKPRGCPRGSFRLCGMHNSALSMWLPCRWYSSGDLLLDIKTFLVPVPWVESFCFRLQKILTGFELLGFPWSCTQFAVWPLCVWIQSALWVPCVVLSLDLLLWYAMDVSWVDMGMINSRASFLSKIILCAFCKIFPLVWTY